MIQILVDHGVFHLLAELLVFEASELDERADIVPVFLIILAVCLEHSNEFICYFLGNVICNFIHKTIVLQCTSGYIQRQIRAVNDSLQYHQEFRDHFFDVIRNEYLIVVQLDRSFNGFILCIDLRKIQDTL